MRVAERENGNGEQLPWPRSGREDISADLGFSILIVDDVEDTRYLYEKYFTFHGARAFTADDGAAALAAVRHDPPDIIVLDLAMPKVTGWEVLQKLKGDPATRTIPIVVVSGQRERTSAVTAGADAYCEKPCLPDALRREVLRVLRRRADSSGANT